MALFPIALLLSYIRTLRRLAIASACANFLQAIGISLILEYLVRDLDKVNMSERDNFRPLNEVALGFGSAMFAFEGISVVLPVYTRMKNSNLMSGCWGVINLSYVILLILYFIMGLFGFLKFGHRARDSITLNLPPEPIYDVVRALFAVAVMLTYPLQFYVPNEIIWNWAKRRLSLNEKSLDKEVAITRATELVVTKKIEKGDDDLKEAQSNVEKRTMDFQSQTSNIELNNDQQDILDRYEYFCRTIIVILTFMLAISVPKLNLLMDLIGSITGTSLSLILPAIIHIAAFWDDTKGFSRLMLLFVDSFIIAFGLVAGASGSVFSLISIVESFHK